MSAAVRVPSRDGRVGTSNRVRPFGSEALDLLDRFGSPLYVYDAAEVSRCYHRLSDAFQYDALACHFAIVCNKNPLLVRLLCRLGAGVHANTPGDAHAALVAGVPPGRIMYSGTNLTSIDFEFLLAHAIPLNLDSLDQLRDLRRRGFQGDVGLRLLIDSPEKRARIGVAPHELTRAVALGDAAGIRIVGVHMYAGTNTRRVSRYFDALDRALEAAEALPDLEYVNLGGGFGVGYRQGQEDLDLAALGVGVDERLEKLSARRGRRIRLVLEPGRMLVATSGTLLCTVVSAKQRGGRRYVGVDATVGNIAVPSIYHGYHRVEAVNPRGEPLVVPTDVCGNTTHSGDFLARDAALPELERGDVIALRDVGAYAYAMSSHFLNRPRPPEVVLLGADVVLTTRRETLADLVRLHTEEALP